MECSTLCLQCTSPKLYYTNYCSFHGVCEPCSKVLKPFVQCIHCQSISPYLTLNPITALHSANPLPSGIICDYCSKYTKSVEILQCSHKVCADCYNGINCLVCDMFSSDSSIIIDIEEEPIEEPENKMKGEELQDLSQNFAVDNLNLRVNECHSDSAPSSTLNINSNNQRSDENTEKTASCLSVLRLLCSNCFGKS